MAESFSKQLRKAVRNPGSAILFIIVKILNPLVDLKRQRGLMASDLIELNEIRQYALRRTGISDHLEKLFVESLAI